MTKCSGVVQIRPSAAAASTSQLQSSPNSPLSGSHSYDLFQLKEEARAIERRLRDALAAVAEQEAAMRADEGEKHRAELRRQEYSRQWSKDDDRLCSLERSVQAFAPQSHVSSIDSFAKFPSFPPYTLYAGHCHSSD